MALEAATQKAVADLQARLVEAEVRAARETMERQRGEVRELEACVVRGEATADTMRELVAQLRADLRALKLVSGSSA